MSPVREEIELVNSYENSFLRCRGVRYKRRPGPVKKIGSYCIDDPRYNDCACNQKFCCKIEFAVIKKLDTDLSKA